MFRLTFSFTATSFILLLLAGGAAPREARAQPQGARQGAAQQAQQVSPELWRLLSDWAKGSAAITTLHGKHERHVYDDAFFVEKVSNGEFWYEGPDKGRIDISAVEITKDMVQRRNDPNAKVERKPRAKDAPKGEPGQPYELRSDEPRRWICDGTKVFDIDDPRKEARIVNLPPNLRGQNIMNSPLPFLFGLPPEKALERFNMKIEDDARPQHDYVLLTATPRLRQDAENWKAAQIYLNTKDFIPMAVKLIDPAGTKRTVYKFIGTEKNKKGFLERFLRGRGPWDPDLRGFQINVIEPGENAEIAGQNGGIKQRVNPPAAPVVPDVVGKAHGVAEQMLIAAGVQKQNIRKYKGDPAPRANLKFLVSAQKPKAGTRLDPKAEIHLLIFTEPVQGANIVQPTNAAKVAGGR